MKLKPSCPGHIAVAKMMSALLDGKQTVYDLRDVCGLNLTTIRRYVLTMRKEKAVYIADWDFDQRGAVRTPMYSLGRGVDAKRKVVKIDNAARMRQSRERKKQINVLLALAA